MADEKDKMGEAEVTEATVTEEVVAEAVAAEETAAETEATETGVEENLQHQREEEETQMGEAKAVQKAADAYEEIEDKFFLEYFDSNRVLASAQRLDYVYLRFIETGERHSESDHGVYISELADATGFPINRISSMMTRLQDKGYIVWRTNTEKDRTYVELTGKAKDALASDMDRNWKLYKAIRENISMDDLVVTARTMHKISELLAEEE